MNKKKKIISFWGRGFLLLMGIMVLFTVISKAAASFTVAKVSVTEPSSRKIQHTLIIEGRIEKNRELSVMTQPDLLVKRVMASVGQRVEKGEVLAVLDEVHLREQLDHVRGEKRALELQNEAVMQNQRQAENKRLRDRSQAQEDYELLKEKNKRTLAGLSGELEKAKRTLKKAERRKDKEGSLVAQREVAEKREVYKAARIAAKEEEKVAKRAIREAQGQPEADNSIEINHIAIKKLEKQIGKLTDLEKMKGEILAPRDGVITEILVNVGQKTLDSAIFTMTDDREGFLFAAKMTPEEATLVSTGDTVTLTASGREEKDLSITSLELDESKEFMVVTVLLPAESFHLGETASMKVTQESENHSCTIPITALRQESGRYYVLVVEKQNTILGEQEKAVKEEVKILDKNEMYAALESESIKEDSQIIADSDRYVEAGDRVRLREE
ncbi:MAG: HlyD family efflux transporter periplasmic adaptor subunit [Eubacterium sp.]|nr:HlyD family efflux transporter periplasmic adaptor subunit [Eubacterium sp.]